MFVEQSVQFRRDFVELFICNQIVNLFRNTSLVNRYSINYPGKLFITKCLPGQIIQAKICY
jgi:hypothetical protein